jgi:hypothetical protein
MQEIVLADHMGNTGLWILAGSLSIYSTGVRYAKETGAGS